MARRDQWEKSWADLQKRFKASGEACLGLYCAMAQLPRPKDGEDTFPPPAIRARMVETLESLAIVCPELHLIPGPIWAN